MLPLLSPNAFRFYLPAFIAHALSNEEGSGTVMQFTLWYLSIGHAGSPEFVAQALTCYARLTDEQKRSVLGFLAYVRDCAPDLAESRDAAAAIHGYWGNPAFADSDDTSQHRLNLGLAGRGLGIDEIAKESVSCGSEDEPGLNGCAVARCGLTFGIIVGSVTGHSTDVEGGTQGPERTK